MLPIPGFVQQFQSNPIPSQSHRSAGCVDVGEDGARARASAQAAAAIAQRTRPCRCGHAGVVRLQRARAKQQGGHDPCDDNGKVKRARGTVQNVNLYAASTCPTPIVGCVGVPLRLQQ